MWYLLNLLQVNCKKSQLKHFLLAKITIYGIFCNMKRSVMVNLVNWKAKVGRKPLILRGARQVGKTYLLKAFGEAQFPQHHYVNFEEDDRLEKIFEEDLNPKRIIEDLKFHLDRSIDPERDLVIFDEIQRCPRALTSLKYFAEDMPRLALCAAGSLLGVVLSKESFPVGKVEFLNLWPMSFDEFLDGTGETSLAELVRAHDFFTPLPVSAHDRLWEIWKRYLVVGGLPESVDTYRGKKENIYEATLAVRRLQRDIIDAYVADIAKHSGKVNALHIERLWRNVPQQLARIQDGAAPKFRFRDAVPGLRGYDRLSTPLDWLEGARLVIRCLTVESVGSPLLSLTQENRFKLYFFDVGMLGAISDLLPTQILNYGFGSYQGYVAENFVAQELCSADIAGLYCWQGRTSEVEFLMETEEGIVPVEVKSGSVTHSRSLGVYEKRYKPARSYILSARNVQSEGPRRHIPIYAASRLKKALNIFS